MTRACWVGRDRPSWVWTPVSMAWLEGQLGREKNGHTAWFSASFFLSSSFLLSFAFSFALALRGSVGGSSWISLSCEFRQVWDDSPWFSPFALGASNRPPASSPFPSFRPLPSLDQQSACRGLRSPKTLVTAGLLTWTAPSWFVRNRGPVTVGIWVGAPGPTGPTAPTVGNGIAPSHPTA